MAEKLAPEKRHRFIHNGQSVFEWDQTLDEVNIYIKLPPNVHTKLFYCKIQSKHIEVGIKGNSPYLNHDLSFPVKTDSSFWTLEDDTMHLTLQKRDKGHTWPSPILGQGQLDPYSTVLEQKRLILQRFQEEVFQNYLPIGANLIERVPNSSCSCVFCDGLEDELHLFFRCPFAKVVWFSSPLGLLMERITGNAAADMCKEVMKSINPMGEDWQNITLMVSILWAIWKHRNAIMFEGKNQNCYEVLQNALMNWQKFLQIEQSQDYQTCSFPRSEIWIPPSAGGLKINVDAAVDDKQNCGAIGLVVRDDLSKIKDWRVKQYHHLRDLMVLEALAICNALELIKEKKWTGCMVETDSKAVADAINGKHRIRHQVMRIVFDIQNLLQQFNNVTCVFVARPCNTLAHKLARSALDVGFVNDMGAQELLLLCNS